MMIRLNYKRVLPICLALHMVACATPPEMPKLTMEVPNAFKESHDWVSATPSDALPRGAWWTLYHQPDLDQLEEQLNAHNNTLAVATAHYKQAEAYAQQLRSALYPSVDLNGGVFNGKQSNSKPLRSSSTPTYYNDFLGGVQINYEVDLWGRVHNMVNSGKQTQEAERATLASVQLSLQAELAQTYFQLRGIDTQIDLTQKSIETYKKSLSLIQNRLENGIATGLDLSRANTILEQTRGQLERLRSQRALAEHAIGALIGSNVSDFSLPVAMMQTALPEIPVGVPSTLLQRRPDIAAAERNVEVANASLGVAKTAYFPNLTLTSLVGYEGKSPGTFLSAPALFWAIGPALATNIFDGGKRKSQIAQAKANLEQSVASYRSAVITAFQQVEDNLSTIDHLSKATSSEQLATEAADKALTISINRYQLGGASYLEVTTSQITALQAKRDLITDQTNIMVASVQLIRALGGGWQTTADQTNTAMNMQSKP